MKRPLARLSGYPAPIEVTTDAAGVLRLGSRTLDPAVGWQVPTTGTVYGVALNFRSALAALGDAVHAAPYKTPPRAPVLYIKPCNTWAAHGAAVLLDPDGVELAVGPTLGLVIGRTATRVSHAEARDVIAGYTVVNDLAVPHDSYYRPAIRQQCRDGFCPIGPVIVPRDRIADPDGLTLRAYVNDTLQLAASLHDLVRPIGVLLSDVTEFMTLVEGDVLMVGLPAALPRARVGDRIAVAIDGIGRLENRLESAPGSIAVTP